MKTKNMELIIYRRRRNGWMKDEKQGVLKAIKYLAKVRPDLFERTNRGNFKIYDHKVELKAIMPWSKQ